MGLRKADLVTGVGICFLGLAALLVALNFSWDLAPVRQAGWYTAPGIVPVGVALVLMLQGIALSAYALRNGGRWRRRDLLHLRQALSSAAVRRATIVATLLSLYVFVLIGRVHFTLASFLFMAAFMFLFRAGAWWKVLMIAAAASGAISFVFHGIARVPLP